MWLWLLWQRRVLCGDNFHLGLCSSHRSPHSMLCCPAFQTPSRISGSLVTPWNLLRDSAFLVVSSWQEKRVPQTSSSRICPKMSWAITRGPRLPVHAHTPFCLDSDGWLYVEIGRPFCSNFPQLGGPFRGLKLCLGCRLRMLLAASDRNSQHKKISKTILLGSLFSDPLSSAFLGTCVSVNLQLVPKRLLQFQASHASTQPLVGRNCSFQPEMIFKTYSRVWTSGKKR